MSKNGIHYAASEQSVLEYDVLKTEKMDKRKDLSDLGEANCEG